MKTTQEYFNMTKEILQKTSNEYGYTKEENLLLDESLETHFYNTKDDATRGAEWLRMQGYCIYTVLKMTDERIAVLAV